MRPAGQPKPNSPDPFQTLLHRAFTTGLWRRAVHPHAFDFEVLYTKSMTPVLDAVGGLDPAIYGVIVIDSISHLWDACRNAFKGRLTKAGTIPLHAWATIKKPYKELMHLLSSSPVHVLICGRQGNDFAEDEESGERKNLGFKMRAEGETAYEPGRLDFGVKAPAVASTGAAGALPERGAVGCNRARKAGNANRRERLLSAVGVN